MSMSMSRRQKLYLLEMRHKRCDRRAYEYAGKGVVGGEKADDGVLERPPRWKWTWTCVV